MRRCNRRRLLVVKLDRKPLYSYSVHPTPHRPARPAAAAQGRGAAAGDGPAAVLSHGPDATHSTHHFFGMSCASSMPAGNTIVNSNVTPEHVLLLSLLLLLLLLGRGNGESQGGRNGGFTPSGGGQAPASCPYAADRKAAGEPDRGQKSESFERMVPGTPREGNTRSRPGRARLPATREAQPRVCQARVTVETVLLADPAAPSSAVAPLSGATCCHRRAQRAAAAATRCSWLAVQPSGHGHSSAARCVLRRASRAPAAARERMRARARGSSAARATLHPHRASQRPRRPRPSRRPPSQLATSRSGRGLRLSWRTRCEGLCAPIPGEGFDRCSHPWPPNASLP